jgi:hypothetical protein
VIWRGEKIEEKSGKRRKTREKDMLRLIKQAAGKIGGKWR